MVEAKNPIRSVVRADDVLAALEEREGATLAELEAEFDLSKATLHSYLATLEQCGFVTKRGAAYHLGHRCLGLGGSVRDREPVYAAGREGADELAGETGELVALVREMNGKCAWLYHASGDTAMPMDAGLGVRLPMHCTASGKAILAELPAERVEAILDEWGLPEVTENTITDQETLLAELETVRERGVAFDDEERIDGMRGIGVPVKTEEGLIGSLAMAGPVNRVEGERFREELPERLTKIRRTIEVRATYSGER